MNKILEINPANMTVRVQAGVVVGDLQKEVEKMDKAVFGNSYNSFFESPWCDAVGLMLDIFLKTHFTEEGYDFINYQLFEAGEHGQKIIETENNKKTTYYLNTMEDVWDYITDNERIDFYVKSY